MSTGLPVGQGFPLWPNIFCRSLLQEPLAGTWPHSQLHVETSPSSARIMAPSSQKTAWWGQHNCSPGDQSKRWATGSSGFTYRKKKLTTLAIGGFAWEAGSSLTAWAGFDLGFGVQGSFKSLLDGLCESLATCWPFLELQKGLSENLALQSIHYKLIPLVLPHTIQFNHTEHHCCLDHIHTIPPLEINEVPVNV